MAWTSSLWTAKVYNKFFFAILRSCSYGIDMIVGKTTISNDGATIMKLLDVVHPAAKTLVDISLSQDAEVRTQCFTG